MYPFLIFDLDPDASDEQVEARYRELVVQSPPDRDPEGFAEVRKAYESLADHRRRLRSWLFHFDDHGRSLTSTALGAAGRPRRRLAADELAALVRRTRE